MIVNVNVVEKLPVKVTASTVSVEIGDRESLNFTADYVLGLHPNEPWRLPQPFGEPERTISTGVLAVIRTAIRTAQSAFLEVDILPYQQALIEAIMTTPPTRHRFSQ